MATVVANGAPSIGAITASGTVLMTWLTSGTPSIPAPVASGFVDFSTQWPSTLPDNFQVSGYTETGSDGSHRSQMETGPDKVRRRTTADIRRVVGSMWLTPAQYTTLRSFYETTLGFGTGKFQITDAHGLTVIYRFAKPPTYTPNGPNNWIVKMDLEELP